MIDVSAVRTQGGIGQRTEDRGPTCPEQKIPPAVRRKSSTAAIRSHLHTFHSLECAGVCLLSLLTQVCVSVVKSLVRREGTERMDLHLDILVCYIVGFCLICMNFISCSHIFILCLVKFARFWEMQLPLQQIHHITQIMFISAHELPVIFMVS